MLFQRFSFVAAAVAASAACHAASIPCPTPGLNPRRPGASARPSLTIGPRTERSRRPVSTRSSKRTPAQAAPRTGRGTSTNRWTKPGATSIRTSASRLRRTPCTPSRSRRTTAPDSGTAPGVRLVLQRRPWRRSGRGGLLRHPRRVVRRQPGRGQRVQRVSRRQLPGDARVRELGRSLQLHDRIGCAERQRGCVHPPCFRAGASRSTTFASTPCRFPSRPRSRVRLSSSQ